MPAAAPLAALGSATFNATLETLLAGLHGDLNASVLDVRTILAEAIADSTRFDLTDATNPCYIPGLSPGTACSPEEAANRLFFDLVHPTTAAHEEIAEIVREHIAPVPVPASLALVIGGIGALGFAARRRTA